MVAIVSVIIAGMLAIQTPQVQTYLSRKLLEKFTAGNDAGIYFGKIHLRPFNTLILKDIKIFDKHPSDSLARDTLFKAEYVIARFSLRGLKEHEGLHIGRAYVRGAEMNLVIEEQQTNLERMFGIRKDRIKKEGQGKSIRHQEGGNRRDEVPAPEFQARCPAGGGRRNRLERS